MRVRRAVALGELGVGGGDGEGDGKVDVGQRALSKLDLAPLWRPRSPDPPHSASRPILVARAISREMAKERGKRRTSALCAPDDPQASTQLGLGVACTRSSSVLGRACAGVWCGVRLEGVRLASQEYGRRTVP